MFFLRDEKEFWQERLDKYYNTASILALDGLTYRIHDRLFVKYSLDWRPTADDLEDETENLQLVNTSALAQLFKLFSGIECIILNACYSEAQATAIVEYVPCVVGMNKAIGDIAAIKFATGFYNALGAGESVEFAYKLGCSVIQLDGIPEHLTPVLLKKS